MIMREVGRLAKGAFASVCVTFMCDLRKVGRYPLALAQARAGLRSPPFLCLVLAAWPLAGLLAPGLALAAESRCKGQALGSIMRTPGGQKLLEMLGPAQSPRSYEFLGEPKPGPYAAVMKQVAAAIQEELGLDAHCIKVVILSSSELERRYSKRGSRIAPGTELGGFHRPGLDTNRTVFVRDEDGVVHAVVLAHEVMHALSQRFSQEADQRRFRKLPEGLAQLFAMAVIGENGEPGEWRWRGVYSDAVAVSESLEKLVGSDVLASAYFVDGVAFLERIVDGKRGAGTFSNAMIALERGYVGIAQGLLAGTTKVRR